jgi:phosphoribosylcarboxyaminoimidazole (NCAIR) mutase
VSDPSVDALRQQLRERGYLSHGIERWFALDPWRSRAFWLELATVALKAATLIAPFAALPMVAVMLFRNFPLSPADAGGMLLVYTLTWLAVVFALVVVIGLILKLRPELAIDTPRALLAISLGAAALLAAGIGWWWYRFDAPPRTAELAAGLILAVALLLVATIVISAALLSFSIHELQRIPAISQKPRGVPIAVAAAVLIAALLLPAYAAQERRLAEPMIVTTPTSRRVALIAVDGLTHEILQSRPELLRAFASVHAAPPMAAGSTAERWASIGTGVPTRAHGVRSIEGIRFRGGDHLIQTLSRADRVLPNIAPLLGLARRQPLPPTVRRRQYVWEVFGERGLTSLAVNWWTSADLREGALESVAQDSIFAAAKADPLAIDATATQRFLAAIARNQPQFATVYLPALDVILNRLGLDESTRLASSVRALDGVASTIAAARKSGYEVILIGLPGDRQSGRAVVASTLPLTAPASAFDLAPTVADLLGFPLSREMPGRSLAGTSEQPRVVTYGNRAATPAAAKPNDEYYENLRSLGYIR